MDLKILKDKELMELLDYTETIADATIPDFLALIPEDCMQVLIKTGNTQGLPHLNFIEAMLQFVFILEEELQIRGIQEEFAKNKCFVNYENGKLMTYSNFQSRYRHLCNLKKNGFLELENIVQQSKAAKSDLERMKRASKEKIDKTRLS